MISVTTYKWGFFNLLKKMFNFFRGYEEYHYPKHDVLHAISFFSDFIAFQRDEKHKSSNYGTPFVLMP
jgi:hypothetical protein